MSQTIFRRGKESKYTCISNAPLNDKSLSWKAKGILCFLLSKPNDWHLIASNISNSGKDGLDSVYAGLKELCEAKYLWKKQIGGKDGGGTLYLIFEEPELKSPFGEKPLREKPQPGIPGSGKSHATNTLENTSVLSTDSTKHSNEEDEYIPDSEETSIVNDNKKTATGELFDSKALCPLTPNSARPPSPQEFIARWNSVFFLGTISRLVGERLRHFNARCREPFFCENWYHAIALIQTIPWMMGKGDPRYPDPIGVDTFLRSGFIDKIIERGDESKLPKKKEKPRSPENIRNSIDPIEFEKWIAEQHPAQVGKWTLETCQDFTIKEFLEQTK